MRQTEHLRPRPTHLSYSSNAHKTDKSSLHSWGGIKLAQDAEMSFGFFIPNKKFYVELKLKNKKNNKSEPANQNDYNSQIWQRYNVKSR